VLDLQLANKDMLVISKGGFEFRNKNSIAEIQDLINLSSRKSAYVEDDIKSIATVASKVSSTYKKRKLSIQLDASKFMTPQR